MASPFVFPSSLRDLERDADGDEEPSLWPQNPIAVATLRAADLEEFVSSSRQQRARPREGVVACFHFLLSISPPPFLVRFDLI
jgi:hypothetical protein